MKHRIAGVLCGLALAFPAQGQEDRSFDLVAPAALVDSGLLKYILPRFSLKTGTRITLQDPATAGSDAAAFGDAGAVAFEGLGRVWRFDPGADPDALRFADWLRSDVGRGTVDAFQRDGETPFTSSVTVETVVAEISFEGDAARGKSASLRHCGRCHVIGPENRMNAIGSTPSFAVLRTLRDWQDRFQAFYVLNPHPAFTQIADVTPPFDVSRPSPIFPVEMTLEDLDNILAFVQAIAPADLGAPIKALKP